ncbi:PHP domain-containing protein [Caldicellulosiruptoraceae bacterium PP1]
MIDLHVHTTASDGTFSPSEVVKIAKQSNLSAIAITDHDTILGIQEAKEKAEDLGIEVISGVEISADFEIEMHILGYFIDVNNNKLIDNLLLLESFRHQRNPKIVEKLQQLGYNITIDEIIEVAKDSIIGRPHIAQVLVNKGYFNSPKEVFEKLLSFGKPAYVKKDKLKPFEAINILKESGGLAILAHPYKFLYLEEGVENVFEELKLYGLDGIEAIHSEHSDIETKKLIELANRFSFLITGGSDFHGKNKPDIKLGVGRNNIKVDDEILERLKERLKK